MLRWVPLACLVAVGDPGCYRPAVDASCRVSCGDEACPSGLECGTDGLCHDGTIECSARGDAGVDAGVFTGPCVGHFGTTVNDLSYTGRGFVPRSDGSLAVYAFNSGVWEQIPADKTGQGTQTNISSVDAARLAPDANYLYAHPSGTSSVVGFTRAAADSWNQQDTITFTGLTLKASDRIGAPSNGPTRHIMMGRMGPTTFGEWTGDTVFTFVRNYGLTYFGLDDMVDPGLTPNGLGLVFVGQPSGGSYAIYYAARSNIDDAFGQAVVLFNDPNGLPASPYLTDGCVSLYWTTFGGHVVQLQ